MINEIKIEGVVDQIDYYKNNVSKMTLVHQKKSKSFNAQDYYSLISFSQESPFKKFNKGDLVVATGKFDISKRQKETGEWIKNYQIIVSGMEFSKSTALEGRTFQSDKIKDDDIPF